MNPTSKATDANKLQLDSPQRRAALLTACIGVMRDRQRHAAARPTADPRTIEPFLVVPDASSTSSTNPPEVRIRRVVTLVPAAGVPDVAIL
jgi:hypothetical protein